MRGPGAVPSPWSCRLPCETITPEVCSVCSDLPLWLWFIAPLIILPQRTLFCLCSPPGLWKLGVRRAQGWLPKQAPFGLAQLYPFPGVQSRPSPAPRGSLLPEISRNNNAVSVRAIQTGSRPAPSCLERPPWADTRSLPCLSDPTSSCPPHRQPPLLLRAFDSHLVTSIVIPSFLFALYGNLCPPCLQNP